MQQFYRQTYEHKLWGGLQGMRPIHTWCTHLTAEVQVHVQVLVGFGTIPTGV